MDGNFWNGTLDTDTTTPAADAIRWGDVKRDGSDYVRDETANTITLTGAVRGAMGTFACSSATPTACGLDPADDTGANPTAGDWVFKPNAGAMVDVADTDYLHFGWWLRTGNTGVPNADGVVTFATAVGYGTAVDATTKIGADLEGTASYKGAAAGKYALLGTNQNSGEAGHWTAAASLTANFDADLSATADGYDRNGVAVEGEITDFMTSNGDRDWTVELRWDADSATAGVQVGENLGPASPSLTAAWDVGGSTKGTGTWTAQYWGTDTDAAAAENYPLLLRASLRQLWAPERQKSAMSLAPSASRRSKRTEEGGPYMRP